MIFCYFIILSLICIYFAITKTNNYLQDLANRGLDPEFTQIANARRREYSAEDDKIRRGKAKMSIIEGYDVNKLSDVDYMLTK